MERSRETNAVIINADSQQLYADLRVLSARPSAEDEAAVSHRLYGVADAAEAWSVGRWSRAVMDLLAELAAEGRPALLVGGTGLYFNALTKGLADIPPVPVETRDAVQAEFDAEGEAALTQAIFSVRARGGIVIVVAHRPSALAAVDMLGVIQNGRLAAFGPRDEILTQQTQQTASKTIAQPVPRPAA
jgi:hypothetical protein